MDVIIIGAGAAGLMAAKQLSHTGKTVCVLEARDRIGGRVHSIQHDGQIIEGGAEFIHGNLEVTLELLKEAGIGKLELEGDIWQVKNGQWKVGSKFFEHRGLVEEKLREIEEDITISEFMQQFFSAAEYQGLREQLSSYVEGYYSGDISKMSAKSFLQQWLSEDEQQYRPEGSYGAMISYMAGCIQEAAGIIRLSTAVKQIRWSREKVEVIDDKDQSYTARKVIITVPLGVWTAPKGSTGFIDYVPSLEEKVKAARQMGFGSVIKVLLGFTEAFWEGEAVRNACKVNTANFHMAISDCVFPTWWTQLPMRASWVTGWLSGPKTGHLKIHPHSLIVAKALESLSAIFNISYKLLEEKLQWSKVFNWDKDPYTRGSYSYSTKETIRAREILIQPVENTLFFAGEAIYAGPEMGTVEAALISGLDVAGKIMKY